MAGVDTCIDDLVMSPAKRWSWIVVASPQVHAHTASMPVHVQLSWYTTVPVATSGCDHDEIMDPVAHVNDMWPHI